ncbi:barstar family protein [Mucilaginibacter gotjawali]|uniref:RNAse (Barnase) inhibitor barstar n=2 Tax=Mucilaginibacter gotjawali TaxID=1550579 RepID=A0A839SIX9_9SPHI|nr:barstar family protein [Mucilaginibacter gotjawali]MBB3057372.1 RNAse (barnase) inhibitor barstar [Mucilaginibacter gotjawali]BAU52863.1 hypothetical protein MgSA37_01027 [Mucilaginibacter gotjawali]
MKTIIINGNNFSDLESFYTGIDKILTKDLTWKTGHNLSAFNDLLCGGFGVFEYNEEIKIIWRNFKKSKSGPGADLTGVLVEIINDHSHIDFAMI